jgi:hypothetical protein
MTRWVVQARLHVPADAHVSCPERPLVRALSDCPDVPVGKTGCRCRVVVATHPTASPKNRLGQTRQGVVSERFFTQLPQDGFTACAVVALSLHRGAFEPLLFDEDEELDPDRWCSHSASGQECWPVGAQWIWKLRLELGHHLHPDPVRPTACAPAIPPPPPHRSPASGSAPPHMGVSWNAGRFSSPLGQCVAQRPQS